MILAETDALSSVSNMVAIIVGLSTLIGGLLTFVKAWVLIPERTRQMEARITAIETDLKQRITAIETEMKDVKKSEQDRREAVVRMEEKLHTITEKLKDLIEES